MLYKTERYKIESVFGKILYNRYGCEELSIIASECSEHDGLHINAEGLYVEVLDGDNQVPGKLVITDLWNKGMPLIRYEIGDMATTKRGLCRCGRGLPRLGEIYGRTSDFLQSPDGKLVSGISILDTFTIHIPGIKQVQIIQDVIDNLHFKIVKDENFNEDSLALLAQNVRTIFGDQMKHETEIVDRIPQTSRGKYKFSICNIPPERDRD
jgi:phenylacetate-CoA ligase